MLAAASRILHVESQLSTHSAELQRERMSWTKLWAEPSTDLGEDVMGEVVGRKGPVFVSTVATRSGYQQQW